MQTHISKRATRGAKRLDDSTMRAWVAKMQSMTATLGIVRLFPGESSHFEIDVDPDTGNHTIYVDCEIVPSGEHVLCKLGFGQDQVYKIPRVNQEVAILIPSDPNSMIKDPLDSGPIIVGLLDSDAPAELDGDDVVVITAPRVIMLSNTIQLGSTAVKLAKESDLQALESAFNTHTHAYAPGTGSPTPTTTPSSTVTPSSGTSKVTGE